MSGTPGGLTSPATNALLVYRDDGTLVGSIVPSGFDALDIPTGISRRLSGALFVANAGSHRISLVLQTQP